MKTKDFKNEKLHSIIDTIEKYLLSLDMKDADFHIQRAKDYCERYGKIKYKDEMLNSIDRVKNIIMLENLE